MTQDVFRRRVFYMPGFDPFPSRPYRELYRSESQEQARISDYTIAQESLRGTDNFRWRVISAIEGPLLIAAILRKYRVSMTEHGRPVPVAHLTVRAKDGIWLDF
jgi:hypothetical protein